jgi:hypothetical protein
VQSYRFPRRGWETIERKTGPQKCNLRQRTSASFLYARTISAAVALICGLNWPCDLPCDGQSQVCAIVLFFSDPGRDDRRHCRVGESFLEQQCLEKCKRCKTLWTCPALDLGQRGAGGLASSPELLQMGRAETGQGGTRMTGVCNPVRLQDPGTYSQLRKQLPGRRGWAGPREICWPHHTRRFCTFHQSA